MNRDITPDKFSNLNYFYLLNGKVITESGLTSGAIENEKGNSLAFRFPDTAPLTVFSFPSGYTGPSTVKLISGGVTTFFTVSSTTQEDLITEFQTTLSSYITAGALTVSEYGNNVVVVGLDNMTSIEVTSGNLVATEIVSSQSDLKILGLGKLDNYIIVMSTNETSTTPLGSAMQIWLLEYNEATDSIVDIGPNSYLVPSKHLVYNNILNVSLNYRAGEIIGRYENSKTGRIYWTDNYNNLRTFNILDESPFSYAPALLDVVAQVSMSVPVVKSIGSGSIPVPSMVQYCYRLVKTGGAQTIVSPVTPLIPLTAFNPETEDYENYIGDSSLGARSVTYTLQNLDTNFDIVEHIVVFYQQKDIPLIYKFAEEFIPESGEIEVTHSGSEEYIDISTQEFNALTSTFDKCKTITTKRNRLVVANLKTSTFDIDFDARAYRFNSAGIAKILDSSGASQLFNSSNYPFNETLDAIAPFSLSDTSPLYDNTFKYKSDGVTLGGSGPKISYSFITEDLTACNAMIATDRPYVSVSRPSTTSTIILDNGLTIDTTNYFKDTKSPLNVAYLKGYMRGEVYRFGIVFYDLKGNPSFVKWIGDIRFPEASDTDYFNGSDWDEELTASQLGIQFNVDINSIKDSISGFSIVRVERTEADKTRLGTGVHVSVPNQGTFSLQNSHNSLNTDTSVNINGTTRSDVRALNDRDAAYLVDGNDVLAFISPLSQFDSNSDYTFSTNDYIKTIGYLKTVGYRYVFGDGIAVMFKGFKYFSPTSSEKFDIEESRILGYGEVLDTGNSFDSGNVIINASFTKDSGSNKYVPFGIGNRKQLLKINGAQAAGMTWNYPYTSSWSGATIQNIYFKIYAYCREVTLQYGGNTYEARATQSYIPCNFVKVSSNDTIVTTDVWSGDTFLNYYTDEIMSQYWGTVSPFDASINYKQSVALMFPVETTLNTKLRSGSFWEQDRDSSDFSAFTYNEYNLFQVYQQENNAKRVFITKDFVDNTVEEHRHRIWASESKLDGEFTDSWRVFKPNNFIEVDGRYGAINKVITHKDKLYFYQDRAFGVASVEDRSVVNDETGSEIILGTGQVLDYYAYISTRTGAFHQFSVVESGSSLYHVDALNRKIFRYTEGTGARPLSDVQGLSAFMAEQIDGDIVNTDKTLCIPGVDRYHQDAAIGIHAEYDARHNRVLFSFLKGDYMLNGNDYEWVSTGFTVSFNESMDAFESFHTFVPNIYLNCDRRLLSNDPQNLDKLYLHNVGTRGYYYDRLAPHTTVAVIVNGQTDMIKVLDIVEFLSELKDASGNDIPNETMTSIQVTNSYQNTGVINFNSNNLVRRFRSWRTNNLRDWHIDKPRLKDHYFIVYLTFENNNNKHLILHDITSHVRI